MDYRLRPATTQDEEFCFLAECAAMREHLETDQGPWDFAEQRKAFDQVFSILNCHVIEAEGHDVGYLGVRRKPQEWHINRFIVLPASQGRGLGTAVLRDLLAQADETGVDVGLDVFENNPARRLYERLGFSVTGRARSNLRMRRASRATGPAVAPLPADQMAAIYGDEYPQAISIHGFRLELAGETRFTRSYRGEQFGSVVSRFMDGTAHITGVELQNEWPAWTPSERLDFTSGLNWYPTEPPHELQSILRFLLDEGSPGDWSTIAGEVAAHLPHSEAVGRLVGIVARVEADSLEVGNLYHALASTRDPSAEPILRARLDMLCQGQEATGALATIRSLIHWGAPPEEFEETVRALAPQCDRSQALVGEYYEWLGTPTLPGYFGG